MEETLSIEDCIVNSFISILSPNTVRGEGVDRKGIGV